jgi:hypothetical protein
VIVNDFNINYENWDQEKETQKVKDNGKKKERRIRNSVNNNKNNKKRSK